MRRYDPTVYFNHAPKGVIVEDAILREPRLWVPGQKPSGKVKIDTSHPLKPTYYWPLTQGNGLAEIVQGGPPIVLQSGGSFQVGPEGVYGLYFNGSSDWGTISGEIMAARTEFSFNISFNCFDDDSMVFGRYGSANDAWLPYFDDDTSTVFIPGDLISADGLTITTHPKNVNRTYFYSYKTVRDVEAALATSTFGKNLEVFTKDRTGGQIPGDASDWIVGADSDDVNDSTIGNWFKGYIYNIGFWKNGLSPEQLNQLALDPYQFLIPA